MFFFFFNIYLFYTEGNIIKANGPSFLIIGIFNSYSIAIINAGSKNTNVFP